MEKGWTLKELAVAAGTTPTQISRLETGKRQLSKLWIQRLSGALGIDPSRFFEEDHDLAHFVVTDEVSKAFKSIYEFPKDQPLPDINRHLYLACSSALDSLFMVEREAYCSPNTITVMTIILHDTFISIYEGIGSMSTLHDPLLRYATVVKTEVLDAQNRGDIPSDSLLQTRKEWVAMFDLLRRLEEHLKKIISEIDQKID